VVHRAERLDHVLERWAKLPISKKQDSFEEGNFTTLHVREEFRCFVAALYGGAGYAENKRVLHGDRDADDVALRCAYYAKGNLTTKDMKAGHTKDGAAFTFAAMLNLQVHYRPELRQFMEGYLGGHMAQRWLEDDEYVLGGGDMARGWFKGRWLKYDEQLRKEWSNLVPSVSAELAVEPATKTPDAIARQSSITELQKALATLAMRLSELRQLVIVAAIILAILIYFRSKY
jgi:hypothetical protein